jgi:hypothetical protein
MGQSISALSIRQPWASAILLGKDVENRSWYSRHRGPLLIHASTNHDIHAWRDPRIVELGLQRTDVPLGHLIGVVNVVDCVKVHASRWADPDSWKLVLSDPHPLTSIVPYRGQLSLFQVPRDLVADLLPAGALLELQTGLAF